MVIARSLRGMNDLFEEQLATWRHIERKLAQIFHTFGYDEIRTPILEELGLFKRTVGETTDIVEKEMFIVADGDNSYCLRPENTAAVVRALIERGGISEDLVEKLYYIGPMFRKERPQKGRLRQFHQFGIELFGVSDPAADIEILVMMDHLFKELGLFDITLKINSLGSSAEKNSYQKTLNQFLSNQSDHLCEDCRRRMIINPLRTLDCKNSLCSEVVSHAPTALDELGKESLMHFDEVREGLTKRNIDHQIDHRLVRGLDYYNKTVFEFVAHAGVGSQNAIAAGGRYDGLFKTLGSKIDMSGIGCAGGIERVLLALGEDKKRQNTYDIALISADDVGHKKAQDLAYGLRIRGIRADFSLTKKSLKAQMRRADKQGCKNIAVIGERELQQHALTIKNLQDKSTKEIALDVDSISRYLNIDMKRG